MKYFYLLSCVLLIYSCKNSIDEYKKEAHYKVNNILVQALEDISNQFKSSTYVDFHQMDSIQYDSIFDQVTTLGAEARYQSDMAIYATEDCVSLPSLIKDVAEQEKAIADSIYYAILTDKIMELREVENLNSYTYFELLVYIKRMDFISLEMASFCPPEEFENIKNWRERIKR